MAKAEFRFFAELNFFLPPNKREVSFAHFFEERGSIKDTIESLGIPHPEVAFIEVNGKSVDFAYIVQDGDKINVYPISTLPEIPPTITVQPQPLSVARFVLDIHLGKLANSLRLLGFDTLYRNDYDDEELAQISANEQRILLTRDKGLLMRSIVSYGYYVRSTNPERQIAEVLQRFDLFNSLTPFCRCLRCNGLLETVAKSSIIDQLPESVRLQVDEFQRCGECQQIYWRGSHYEQMQQFINNLLEGKTRV
ncbi:MAG TPA: twitching motility protein PilT [Cyanobacteria bacterium UBA11371]|nr:twitching motility protein PilT [Cyanobacteria bacterium UBA11371]